MLSVLISAFSSSWGSCYLGGVILLLSSSSVLVFWALLELNLIFFLGIMFLSDSAFKFMGMIKYFIVQSLASSALLLGFLSENFQEFAGLSGGLLTSALLMKLGVAPFQEWVLSLMKDQPWLILALLTTVQKLGPLMGLCYFLSPILMKVSLGLSVIFSALGVSGVSSMRQLLGYSSIFNTGWLLIMPGSGGFLIGAAVYFYSTFLVMSFFFYSGVFNWGGVKMAAGSASSQMAFMLSVLSLGGVPPLAGAYFKLVLFFLLLDMSQWILLVALVASSGWFLWAYVSASMAILSFQVSSPSKTGGVPVFQAWISMGMVALPFLTSGA